MPKAFSSAPKVKTRASAERSLRLEKKPTPERRGSVHSSLPGSRLSRATFSCGQAWTQSRQKVQSMFPFFSGRKSISSHPRCTTVPACRVPVMQSSVSQVAQTSVSRTVTSSGERVEAMKLNWPMGQTHLQNEAFLNRPSTARAPPK